MNVKTLIERGVTVAERYLVLATSRSWTSNQNDDTSWMDWVDVRIESYARTAFSIRKWRREQLRAMKRMGIDRKWRKNFFKLDSLVVRPEIQMKQEVSQWPKVFVIELTPKIEVVER